MLERLDELNRFGFCYYFQFTLNDYEAEQLEPNVPPLEERIETFKRLSQKIGKERVIWRFDPIILTDRLTCDDILSRIRYIGDCLASYTQKLVISFADIDNYPKVRNNLRLLSAACREPTLSEMTYLAEEISKAAREWQISVSSCCETIDLNRFAIGHNRCIDPNLLLRLTDDIELTNFLSGPRDHGLLFGESSLNADKLKDKGQRKQCGCVYSKDIGQYSTCPHHCAYCYANRSNQDVEKNKAAFSLTAESILAEDRCGYFGGEKK